MGQSPTCDICGRSAIQILRRHLYDEIIWHIEPDGLRICQDCQKRLTTRPVMEEPDAEPDEAVRALIGKSAGAICRTLELPFVPPYAVIIEAASKIAYDQDLYMSAWLFVTQWLDGSTVWRDPDSQAIALVSSGGNVIIQEN